MDPLSFLAQDDFDEIRVVSMPLLPFALLGLWFVGGWVWGYAFGPLAGDWKLATLPFTLADGLGATGALVVPLAGLAMIALATRRVTVRICALDRVVIRESNWLFAFSGSRVEVQFSRVRFIDFSCTQGPRRHGSGLERAALGDRRSGYYRLDMVVNDRDSIHLCSGTNRAKLADLGQRIARMTNSRLG